MSTKDLSLYENFIETIAQLLSKALSDKETERLLGSFSALQLRTLQLSSMDNLKRLEETASKRRICKHKGSCSENCIFSVFRSFLITYALKYALGFVPSLLMGKIWKNPKLIFKLGGRDTTSFALFFSVFIASYKGILCMMRKIRNRKSPLNAFVAGTVAGFSLVLDSNQTRRVMIALYLSTRTFHFIARYLWRHHMYHIFLTLSSHEIFESSPQESNELESEDSEVVKPDNSGTVPKRFFSFNRPVMKVKEIKDTSAEREVPVEEGEASIHEHNADDVREQTVTRKWLRQTIGTITMALASSQILYAYVCQPDTLARSCNQITNADLQFLITHGGIRSLQPTRPRQYLDAMGATIDQSAYSASSKFISNMSTFRDSIPPGLPVDQLEPFGAFLSQVPHQFVLCAIQHPPTSSCAVGAMNAFIGEWKRAFALYAPLNVVNWLYDAR